MKNTKKHSGFTLVELMITLGIIAILIAISYPGYQFYMQKTQRKLAGGALLSFSQALEKSYIEDLTYLGKATQGANTGQPDPYVFVSQSPIDGSTKTYNLTIAVATKVSYKLRATPIQDSIVAGTGRLELSSTGQRCWYKDHDTSGGVCTAW